MLRKIKGYVDSELGINISKRSNKEAYTLVELYSMSYVMSIIKHQISKWLKW